MNDEAYVKTIEQQNEELKKLLAESQAENEKYREFIPRWIKISEIEWDYVIRDFIVVSIVHRHNFQVSSIVKLRYGRGHTEFDTLEEAKKFVEDEFYD